MSKKLPDTITEEELFKIVKATHLPKYKLAFMLGFYQCMRVSEVAKLRKENVNKLQKLLYIKQAKGHKDRNIPIAPEVITKLKYLPCGSDYAKDKGVRAIQYAFGNVTKRVLGRKLNFHILRHSGITHYLVKKKWSSLQVQRLAGHSRISTTEIYTHINPEDLVNRMWE
jgi:integrase